MSRTGISYSDVANAAIKVQAQNDNPTVDRIREILGTGSKSTIARHLKDWKANNGPIASANELPAELIAVVTGLWEHLQNTAEQQITEYRQESNKTISELEDRLKLTQKNNAEQQEEICQIQEALGKEKIANQNLKETIANEKIETSKNQARIQSLEVNLTEHKDENIKLHTLLHNVQNNLEHYQVAMQKLQQEQSLIAERQKLQFDQELSNLRNQLFVAINDANDLKLQIEKLQHQATRLENIEHLNQELEQTLKTKEIQLMILDEKHKEIVRQNESNIKALDIKSKQLVEAEQQTAIAMSRQNDIKQLLHTAEDIIANLRLEQIVQLKAASHIAT